MSFQRGRYMGGSRSGGLEVEIGADWLRFGRTYQTGYRRELRQQLREKRYIFESLAGRLPGWMERRLVHGLIRVKLGWVWWSCFVPDLYIGRLERASGP